MSFDERAGVWDSSGRRQELADAVAKAISERIELKGSFNLLDVGAGTGLLTRRLLPYVSAVTGVDSSKGMLEKFSELGERVTGVQSDILSFVSDRKFDGIISSMTLHHIEDTEALFRKLHSLLKPGGFIALADLAPEDGSFHKDGNEGVYHFGFDEKSLKSPADAAGFHNLGYRVVHNIEKDNGRIYEIFLFTAFK